MVIPTIKMTTETLNKIKKGSMELGKGLATVLTYPILGNATPKGREWFSDKLKYFDSEAAAYTSTITNIAGCAGFTLLNLDSPYVGPVMLFGFVDTIQRLASAAPIKTRDSSYPDIIHTYHEDTNGSILGWLVEKGIKGGVSLARKIK